jgi:hypothetical protein
VLVVSLAMPIPTSLFLRLSMCSKPRYGTLGSSAGSTLSREGSTSAPRVVRTHPSGRWSVGPITRPPPPHPPAARSAPPSPPAPPAAWR